jgi:hypothetical protein
MYRLNDDQRKTVADAAAAADKFIGKALCGLPVF